MSCPGSEGLGTATLEIGGVQMCSSGSISPDGFNESTCRLVRGCRRCNRAAIAYTVEDKGMPLSGTSWPRVKQSNLGECTSLWSNATCINARILNVL